MIFQYKFVRPISKATLRKSYLNKLAIIAVFIQILRHDKISKTMAPTEKIGL